MINRVQVAVALGMVVALGAVTIAYADGVTDNTPFVDGNVKPSKLDREKRSPVALFTEVRTEGPVTGSQQNPEQELIEYDRDGKWKSTAAPFCAAEIEVPGLTADQARALCPPASYIGSGDAEVALNDTVRIDDVTVSVFNGPAKNEIRLHTSSPTLGASAPTVFGRIVRSENRRKYGPALLVEDAPDAGGDAFMITKFNATIFKSSGISSSRCSDKKLTTRRTVTYDDGTQEVAKSSQRCKRRKADD